MIGKSPLSCLQHFGTSVACFLGKAIISQTFLGLQWQFWDPWVWQLWPLTQEWQRGQRNLRSPLQLQQSVAALCPQVWWRTWFKVPLFSQIASSPSQKASLKRCFASPCQSPGSSLQSVACCQLHSLLSCWICQVSLILYHCAFLPIFQRRSPFPMSPHLASTLSLL